MVIKNDGYRSVKGKVIVEGSPRTLMKKGYWLMNPGYPCLVEILGYDE